MYNINFRSDNYFFKVRTRNNEIVFQKDFVHCTNQFRRLRIIRFLVNMIIKIISVNVFFTVRNFNLMLNSEKLKWGKD